jgi:signal transduction histidine kinase
MAPLATPALSEGDQLRARVASLEDERRRAFDEAQREADAMFAQYQLSQLLASGDNLEKLAPAVLAEIARTSGAGAAALWLAAPARRTLHRIAALEVTADPAPGEPAADTLAGADLPARFTDSSAAERWATRAGWFGVPLEESLALGTGGAGHVALGYLAVRPRRGRTLDSGHARYLGLVRRELALAFRAAQLRGALVHERATLAAILDGASDAIIAVDSDCRITRLNGAAARLVGAAEREGIGATCEAFLGCLPEAGGPRGCGRTCPFREVLTHGRPLVREQVIAGLDADPIPVAASYAQMTGSPAGAVAVLRDLREARALDALKSSFVAAISHELRTPLALISGHSQSLLHLGLDAPTSRHHLERIGDAVDRLGALVDDVIDVSRIESDQLQLERAPASLEALLRAFATEQGELLGAPPITLDLPALPLVNVDARRIRQVLANLAANTQKYAGTGASITIRARHLPPDSVIVTFADDGVGVDPAEQAQVFDRFFRGGRVRESRIPGSGLGLYVCRRLVEAHGGWIRLDTTRRGTSISFRLSVLG